MLLKCKRSCNLCGDLVDRKDRIQPSTTRRTYYITPSRINYNGYNNQDHLVFESSSSSPESHTSTIMSDNYYKYLFDSDDQIPPSSDYTYDTQQSSTSKYENNDYNLRKVDTTTQSSNQIESFNSEVSKNPNCVDKIDYCPDLASRGDCTLSQEAMRHYCPKSCNFC